MLKKSGKFNNSLISLQENKMPNHCSIVGCTSGYKQTQEWPSTEFVSSFHYPFSKPQLLQKWITFTDRKDWTLNSFHRDVWETFSWRCYESRVTKSQPYPNEERTSLVESDSSMNQILNYGENHFRLKIWSQISCLISSLKIEFHRMPKLKESIVHPPFKSLKPKIQ